MLAIINKNGPIVYKNDISDAFSLILLIDTPESMRNPTAMKEYPTIVPETDATELVPIVKHIIIAPVIIKEVYVLATMVSVSIIIYYK